MIICGDATDKDLLIEEGLLETEAFVATTNFDEENIMLALFAKSLSSAKLITKVHRISYDDIIRACYIYTCMCNLSSILRVDCKITHICKLKH